MTSSNLGFHVLLCGFDKDAQGFILDLSWPNLVMNATIDGFRTIGSGSSHALSRLLFSEYKRSHPLERVLYDAFGAKADAEMVVGAGYEWDAKILIAGKPEPIDVPKEIKDIIERVWSRFNRSPFEWDKWDRTTDLPPPPKDWKRKLQDWTSGL